MLVLRDNAMCHKIGHVLSRNGFRGRDRSKSKDKCIAADEGPSSRLARAPHFVRVVLLCRRSVRRRSSEGLVWMASCSFAQD